MFREHVLACFITDPSGLKLRHEIGIDNIAWECDYPHTDTTWPESPELLWSEFQAAGATEEEIHKITWENACHFFDWDPFDHLPKEQATVGGAAGAWRPTSIPPGCPVPSGEAQRRRWYRHVQLEDLPALPWPLPQSRACKWPDWTQGSSGLKTGLRARSASEHSNCSGDTMRGRPVSEGVGISAFQQRRARCCSSLNTG